MSARGFERKRQRIFERHAKHYLALADPESALCRARRGGRGGGCEIRASAYASAAWAMTGREALAWRALAGVLDHQDRNPDSMTRGNFKWYTDWEFARDPNAVSFIIPVLWYIHRHRAEAMPPGLRARLEEAFRLAAGAIDAHRGGHLSYTNIILLNLASRLCIADALDLPGLRALAGWEWEEWRNHILRTGFLPEYNAPVYTGVQVDALAIMLACAAPPELHAEMRNFMRHIIAEAVVNRHETTGLLTGPQSRGHYATAGTVSFMDTIFHFVLGTPEPSAGCILWLGAPLSRDDLLPAVRDLPLPRLNRAYSPMGVERVNYLERRFTLGSMSTRNRISTPETPFFFSWASENPRCGIPVVPAGRHSAHYARQEKGRLLAASAWLTARRDEKRADGDGRGRFSRLNTGTPYSIINDRAFRPGFTLPLGAPGTVSVHGADGRAVSPPAAGRRRRLAGDGVLLVTEGISAGLRFFAPGKVPPRLELALEGDELVLAVTGPRAGRDLNGLERAVFCGLCLEITPGRPGRRPAALIPSLSGLKKTPLGWRAGASFRGGRSLDLDIDLCQASFYEAGGRAVTPNLLYLDDLDGA